MQPEAARSKSATGPGSVSGARKEHFGVVLLKKKSAERCVLDRNLTRSDTVGCVGETTVDDPPPLLSFFLIACVKACEDAMMVLPRMQDRTK